MFLSTRGYQYGYNFIVKASKKNCENIVKKKIDLLLFEKKKLPSIKYIFFLIYIICSGIFFRKNRAKIKYNNIEIGRFILAETFCNYDCYLNKLSFYKKLFKNFIHAGSLINSCNYYNTKFEINGAYIDHCGYLNGIIFSFFALKKKILYTNNYPHGIYYVNYKKSHNKYLLKYENSLRINIKKKLNDSQKIKAELKISNIVKKATYIPYMIRVNYKKLEDIDYQSFDYVIYCHSFTDGQLWHGYAGFENMLEWLEFTLDNLIKKNKKILVKPHPNFYNRSLNAEAIWDKKIYDTVVKKYKKNKNLFFVKTPIHNYLLLKKLNIKCILLSGFGTAILESAYMNFKSICTSHNFFHKKFKISNMWNNKINYLKLLNLEFSQLKSPLRSDLLELCYMLSFHYTSTYHKNFFNNIIRKNLKLSLIEYQKQFATRSRAKISQSKLKEMTNATKPVEERIVDQISKTMFEVRQ